MGRPQYDHWDIRILHPVLSLIQDGYQTLEVHLVKAASTRDNFSKGGDRTDSEPMEPRGTKFAVTVKEIYFIRTYFSKNITLYKVLHQYRLVQ